mgnify:CR=1 FL=1
MRITWLGQAGLLIETNNVKIMVDPYLSDSVEKVNPLNCRRVRPDENFFKIRPDVIVLTHDHLDHADPETLEKYLKTYSGTTTPGTHRRSHGCVQHKISGIFVSTVLIIGLCMCYAVIKGRKQKHNMDRKGYKVYGGKGRTF